MAIVESKLKTGMLTLGGTGSPPVGGVEFACQATNVRIVPTFNDTGDPVETLCGDTLSADTTADWALQGTSIQDFDSPDGFIQFSWENNLVNTPFTWKPNASSVSYAGTVQVRALEVGGDVNTRLTTDFDWPCQGMPDATWPVAGGAAADEEPAQEDEDEGQEEQPYQEPEPQVGETTTYSTH